MTEIALSLDFNRHGTGEVTRALGNKIAVHCPHCGRTHIHERSSLGSRSVLAGCSRPGKLRTYAIPRKGNRNDRK